MFLPPGGTSIRLYAFCVRQLGRGKDGGEVVVQAGLGGGGVCCESELAAPGERHTCAEC